MGKIAVCFLAAVMIVSVFICAPAGADDWERLEGLWARGETHLDQGDIDGALVIFQQALEIDREQPRTWNYLGGVQFIQKNYFKALLNFKEAFALDPSDGRACNNIATAYEHLGRREEAEGYYLRAVEIDENYPIPYRNLGILYAEHFDKPKLARTYWQKFLELAPAGPESDAVREALKGLDTQQGD